MRSSGLLATFGLLMALAVCGAMATESSFQLRGRTLLKDKKMLPKPESPKMPSMKLPELKKEEPKLPKVVPEPKKEEPKLPIGSLVAKAAAILNPPATLAEEKAVATKLVGAATNTPVPQDPMLALLGELSTKSAGDLSVPALMNRVAADNEVESDPKDLLVKFLAVGTEFKKSLAAKKAVAITAAKTAVLAKEIAAKKVADAAKIAAIADVEEEESVEAIAEALKAAKAANAAKKAALILAKEVAAMEEKSEVISALGVAIVKKISATRAAKAAEEASKMVLIKAKLSEDGPLAKDLPTEMLPKVAAALAATGAMGAASAAGAQAPVSAEVAVPALVDALTHGADVPTVLAMLGRLSPEAVDSLSGMLVTLKKPTPPTAAKPMDDISKTIATALPVAAAVAPVVAAVVGPKAEEKKAPVLPVPMPAAAVAAVVAPKVEEKKDAPAPALTGLPAIAKAFGLIEDPKEIDQLEKAVITLGGIVSTAYKTLSAVEEPHLPTTLQGIAKSAADHISGGDTRALAGIIFQNAVKTLSDPKAPENLGEAIWDTAVKTLAHQGPEMKKPELPSLPLPKLPEDPKAKGPEMPVTENLVTNLVKLVSSMA